MDYKQFEGHTPESHEQRIRKAGEEYANHFENLSSYRIGLDSFIIGATAENKRFFETVKEMETLIESLKLELKKQKEKEILGDRMIVDLEHQKTILKSELEKQKELNAELVNGLTMGLFICKSAILELESLIKKSSEI